MKKIIRLSLLAAALLLMAGTVAAQTKMVRLTRFEGVPITGVSASTAFQVEIYPSDKTSAVVELPAEWEDRLTFYVDKNGILRIGLDGSGLRNIKAETLRARVYLNQLALLSANSAARIRMTGPMTVERIRIDANSAGRVSDLDLTVRTRAQVSANSAGKIQGTLRADEIRCDVNSAAGAQLEVNAASLTCDANSSGTITLSGIAGTVVATANSAGSVNGEELDAKVANLSANSAGSVRVGHVGTLTAGANSGGSVRYVDAEVTNIRSSTSGRVRKMAN